MSACVHIYERGMGMYDSVWFGAAAFINFVVSMCVFFVFFSLLWNRYVGTLCLSLASDTHTHTHPFSLSFPSHWYARLPALRPFISSYAIPFSHLNINITRIFHSFFCCPIQLSVNLFEFCTVKYYFGGENQERISNIYPRRFRSWFSERFLRLVIIQWTHWIDSNNLIAASIKEISEPKRNTVPSNRKKAFFLNAW